MHHNSSHFFSDSYNPNTLNHFIKYIYVDIDLLYIAPQYDGWIDSGDVTHKNRPALVKIEKNKNTPLLSRSYGNPFTVETETMAWRQDSCFSSSRLIFFSFLLANNGLPYVRVTVKEGGAKARQTTSWAHHGHNVHWQLTLRLNQMQGQDHLMQFHV